MNVYKNNVVLFLLVMAISVAFSCSKSSTGQNNLEPPDQTPQISSDPYVYVWEPLVPQSGSLVFKDTQTSSVFNLRGEAISGPLAEKKLFLKQLPGISMFWFAWSVFFPDSEVYGRSERVRAATLPVDKTGFRGCAGGFDCIPSLPNVGRPTGDLNWAEPDSNEAAYLSGSDRVVGVFYDGLARAYPHNILNWHEIANDHIGDRKFTISYCPLTFSTIVWDTTDNNMTFGVSGQLYNSNLIMYDHTTKEMWSQLWIGSAQNENIFLPTLPASEMSWALWKKLHPDTLVLSQRTGFSRDYDVYPYGDYKTDNTDTFRVTDPKPDPLYPNKTLTFGLVDREKGAARAYVHSDLLSELGSSGVTNDSFDANPVVIIYQQQTDLVLAFEATTPEGVHSFEAAIMD